VRHLLLALGLLGGLALPVSAQAAMPCTPSGDACASVTVDRAGAVLRVDSLVPLEDPGVCVLPRRGPVRCVALEVVSVRPEPATLYSARLRVPSASLELLPGSYLVQFGARGALIGSPLRLRIGGPARANAVRLRLAAPSEVAVGQQTTVVLSGTAGAKSLRVLLSPLPGGGNCCGVAVAPAARRLDADRVELRFAWPRTFFRCGRWQHCSRVAWGRRGRITIVSEPVEDIVAHDVVIRRGPAVLRSVATSEGGRARSFRPTP
jgi:hypothetical protein